MHAAAVRRRPRVRRQEFFCIVGYTWLFAWRGGFAACRAAAMRCKKDVAIEGLLYCYAVCVRFNMGVYESTTRQKLSRAACGARLSSSEAYVHA